MGTHTLAHEPTHLFAEAIEACRRARVRPEVRLTEVPAPQRVAPHAAAFSAEVAEAHDPDAVLATGRFVLLHDPDGPQAWDGTWRVVTFARADLESELATDPLLGSVGWTWLLESLADADAVYTGEAGTVTRVVNESFGGLAERPAGVEVEVRASWSPLLSGVGHEVATHVEAWANLLCTVAGLAPLPEGVTALPGRRA